MLLILSRHSPWTFDDFCFGFIRTNKIKIDQSVTTLNSFCIVQKFEIMREIKIAARGLICILSVISIMVCKFLINIPIEMVQIKQIYSYGKTNNKASQQLYSGNGFNRNSGWNLWDYGTCDNSNDFATLEALAIFLNMSSYIQINQYFDGIPYWFLPRNIYTQ